MLKTLSKKSPPLFRFRALFSIALVFCAGEAHAGAWLQKEGDGQAIVNYFYLNSSSRFDEKGHEVNASTFVKNEINPYIEYGLTEDWTIGGAVSIQSIIGTDTNNEGAITEMRPVYADLFVRTYLLTGEDEIGSYVISIQPGLRIPMQESAGINPEGDDIIPELKIIGGHNFRLFERNHFTELSAAYRSRKGLIEDMTKIEATVGFDVYDDVVILPQLFYEKTLGRMSGDTNPANYDLLKGQLSVVYQFEDDLRLQAGAYYNLDGTNTAAGEGLVFSTWYEF